MASSTAQQLAAFNAKPTKFKVGVFVGVAVLLGGAYWQVFYSGLTEDVDSAKSSRQTLIREQKKLDADLVEYKRLRERNDELQQTIRDNQRALPSEAELPAFFDHLQRRAGEAGVNIKKWVRKAEAPVESFIRVPVDIEIAGTYYQVLRYFSLLGPAAESEVPSTPPTGPDGEATDPVDEAGTITDRIVSIENLSIGPSAIRNDEVILIAKFTASTFRQAEAAPAYEAPKPDAAKKGMTGDAVKKLDGANRTKESQVDSAAGADSAKPGADNKAEGQ